MTRVLTAYNAALAIVFVGTGVARITELKKNAAVVALDMWAFFK